MNWIFGLLMGLLIALTLWRLVTQHEKKYAAKRQALIQHKLDRIADTKQHQINKEHEKGPMIEVRFAQPNELETLQTFLVSQGTNQWNYLPEDGVREQFQRINDGRDQCLVAMSKKHTVGIAIYRQPGDAPTLFDGYVGVNSMVYVAEVTVHAHWGGQGIGSALLEHIATAAKEQGVDGLIIDRHEQNLASARMMRKAGFVEVDCFLDLKRRHTGSRKTTILKRCLTT